MHLLCRSRLSLLKDEIHHGAVTSEVRSPSVVGSTEMDHVRSQCVLTHLQIVAMHDVAGSQVPQTSNNYTTEIVHLYYQDVLAYPKNVGTHGAMI